MMLPLTPCGSKDISRIIVLLWTQLIIFVSTDQPEDITKKTPTDLMCYQNYTIKDNFCYCSWKAGEKSQNATYTLYYRTLEKHASVGFDAGHQTYFITDSQEMHFKRPIYIWVEANEGDKIYYSTNITIVLNKAVKLDPPDIKNVSMEKHGSSVTVHWTRIDRFSESMQTRREIQYKVKEHAFVTDQCKAYEASNTPNCVLIEYDHTKVPLCKESCTFNLDGNKEHYIQIRQKYEEGVWSEWSHSVFIPADMDYNLHASYKMGEIENYGIRTLRLEWKLGRENQGDINYDITLTLLQCPDAKLHTRTKNNWFNATISGGSYNATIVASNQAETSPPQSLIMDEDITATHVSGSDFENVTLSERQLIIKWAKTTEKPATYCTEWKAFAGKGIVSSNITRKYQNNYVNISTDHFNFMQCYRIRIHTFDKSQHSTVRTAYYFRPSVHIGPENLTVANITSQSVLLQWNMFDLQLCQGLLKSWEITITDENTNISKREISTVTQHLVEHLSLGFRCTFEVRGVTIYGEYTGRSKKSVFNPWTDTDTNNKWLPFMVIPICLLIGAAIYVTRTRLKMYLFPVLPDPSKSNVTTFVPNDSNYVLCPKYLIDTNSENRQTDSLMIETNVAIKNTKMIFKEPEIKQMAITSGILDNDIFVVAEDDTDQFAYKKQAFAMTPSNGKEVLIVEIRKPNDDDLVTEVDLKENATLLSTCKDALCV
ncbi:interleukin-12 receptor subunit beta-1 [Mantella aurantiaca]